ncbi:MAG TPA: hypothetical protein VNI01_12320 [Elusimicrobiota bacterium]|nr:hypothetical protein [Elusimicrobiota bacterium]
MAALLFAAPAIARADDKLTLEASYPSPSGVYDTVRSKKLVFIPYKLRTDMNVTMPDPGTFAYCKENDTYYASSSGAVASDPGTWWYRIQLDDTPENIYAQGSIDFLQPNNSYAWTKPITVTVGRLWYYNIFLRSKIKITSAGTYTNSAVGRLCEVLPSSPTAPTAFVGPTASTVFKLQTRFDGTRPAAEQSTFTLSLAPDQEGDCYINPADITPTPANSPMCYCAPFTLTGTLSLPVGDYPYTSILSWGTKSAGWNASKHFGGYIVHVDDIKIYK